jgi:hypothetical protein
MNRQGSYSPWTPHHHGTHRNLLVATSADVAPRALVDAVIVPAARPVESLDTAIEVARELGCVLVAICSQQVKADELVDRAVDRGTSVVAFDVDAVDDDLPSFETSAVVADSRFERFTDLSRKRNLALLLARMAGWQRVLLLDDDIRGVHASDVCAAAGLLNRYDAIGLRNRGFPDNSVVCHVGREVGFDQDQFIGAGCLVIAPSRVESFFPDIYNEDWLFLLGGHTPPRLAVTGRMRQRTFNPYADPDRARREELGDCLAEGLVWLLDDGQELDRADLNHWRRFLNHRKRFIDELLQRLDASYILNAGMVAAVNAARQVCTALAREPDVCEGYVQLWRSDLVRWRKYLAKLPEGLGVEKALAELGWYGAARLHSAPPHQDDPLLCVDGRSGPGRA